MLSTPAPFPNAGSFAMRHNEKTGKYDFPVRILRNNGDGTVLTGDPVAGGRRRHNASINCNVELDELLPSTRKHCLELRSKAAFAA